MYVRAEIIVLEAARPRLAAFVHSIQVPEAKDDNSEGEGMRVRGVG